MIKLRILRCRDFPGLSEWDQSNYNDSLEAKGRERSDEEEFRERERERSRFKDVMLLALRVKEEAMNQRMQTASRN